MEHLGDLVEKEMEDAASLIQQLVSIPTESPEGVHYKEFIDLLENEIHRRLPEFRTERIIIPSHVYDRFPDYKAQLQSERIILMARSPRTGREKIHVNGHYDVVKEGDPAKWTMAPAYSPRLIDGRIYGRGACDMKGSIVAFLKALEMIRKLGLRLHYDLEVSFTPDEEIGVYGGVLYLAEETLRGNKLIDSRFFFSLDGTQNEINIGKTGLISFEAKIKGRSVHSCRSFLGVNAIFRAIPVLQAIEALKPKIEQRVSRFPANPDLPLLRVRPNLNVTLVRGGFAAHAVPDECWIYGDRNVLPDESEHPMEDAKNELVNCLLETKQAHQIDMDFKVEEVTPAFASSPDDPHVQRLSHAAEQEGVVYPISCSMGSNDIAHVPSKLGICTVSRGVQREDCNVHAYNENVPLANVKIGIRDLIRFLSDPDFMEEKRG
jgi:succinyl-diaminopimelate desuccinylase